MSTEDIDVSQEAVTAAEVTIYTAPTASNFKSAKITGGLCSNASATNTELTMWVVQFGETTALTNRYFPSKVVFANEVDLLTSIAGAGITLKSGDFIVTQGSIAGNLNVKLSIVEKYSD